MLQKLLRKVIIASSNQNEKLLRKTNPLAREENTQSYTLATSLDRCLVPAAIQIKVTPLFDFFGATQNLDNPCSKKSSCSSLFTTPNTRMGSNHSRR